MMNERVLRLQAKWEGTALHEVEGLVSSKFTYICACQLYGEQKKRRDPKAADTEFLMRRFRNLRVAYIDSTTDLMVGEGGIQEVQRFYLVLIKLEMQPETGKDRVVEIYRVQLP